jgi:hypothetical protein
MNHYDTIDRQDITGYSDQELSLLVYNTEYLYNLRHRYNLKDLLEQDFIFTDSQWDTLLADLELEDSED